jgi:hypothetical protein
VFRIARTIASQALADASASILSTTPRSFERSSSAVAVCA